MKLISNFVFALFSDEGDDDEHHPKEEPPLFKDFQLAQLIDPVLQNDDRDNDGMIDYSEFIIAQMKTKRGERDFIEVSV